MEALMDEQLLRSAATADIVSNPENPRLIFRERELLELEKSIDANGILVPLTVYRSSKGNFVLLDGERRWRCAKKLNLPRVPIIVQPEPSLMQNIMMMFAIHNARTDWDPLPTAQKLRKLEGLYEHTEGKKPNEVQLAQLASLTRGEVRRLKNILNLPEHYIAMVEEEQDLPKEKQTITVDHLLEITRASLALQRAEILSASEGRELEAVLIDKTKSKVVKSTVDPRKLSRMVRAQERGDLARGQIRASILRIISDPSYSIDDAWRAIGQRVESDHTFELGIKRLLASVREIPNDPVLSEGALDSLRQLRDALNQLFEN
jgi:ParB/RepB/Spo0J family partition protein